MRRWFLTTVSVIALGFGTMGLGYAQGNSAAGNTAAGNSGSAATTAPGMHAAPQPANPTTGGQMQPQMSSPTKGPATSGQATQAMPSNMQNMTGGEDHTGTSAGLSRSEVKQAQEKLRQDNFYHGHIDGLVGPKTREALRRYQSANGLHVTANLDQQTLESLLGTGSSGVGSSSPR